RSRSPTGSARSGHWLLTPTPEWLWRKASCRERRIASLGRCRRWKAMKFSSPIGEYTPPLPSFTGAWEIEIRRTVIENSAEPRFSNWRIRYHPTCLYEKPSSQRRWLAKSSGTVEFRGCVRSEERRVGKE